MSTRNSPIHMLLLHITIFHIDSGENRELGNFPKRNLTNSTLQGSNAVSAPWEWDDAAVTSPCHRKNDPSSFPSLPQPPHPKFLFPPPSTGTRMEPDVPRLGRAGPELQAAAFCAWLCFKHQPKAGCSHGEHTKQGCRTNRDRSLF